VRFVLDTPPDISWWKAIRFAQYDPKDGKISYSEEIYTQDQIKTAKTSDLTLDQLQNGTLEFKKAATFGVHTGFYLMDAEELKSIRDRSQVTFKWIKD